MNEKFCIFVSSVQKELADERRAIKSFIANDPLLRQFFTVFLFEDIPATDRNAEDVYLEHVDKCAVYTGLFGSNYGIPGQDNISPTEREFDRATAAAKPRFVFVKGDSDDRRDPRMLSLIQKAGEQLVRRRFTSIPELTAGLYASLVDYLVRTGAIQTGPFDATTCTGTTIADLSGEKIEAFLSRAQQERRYALSPGTPTEDALRHLNLLKIEHPTNAAILLFGKQPQKFLNNSGVMCLYFPGTEVRKPILSQQAYKGDIFELVDKAVDFAMGKLNRAVGTRELSNDAPVTFEIPRAAIAEAIVNAVAHRDYSSTAFVQVMLFSDRLEVWNPGELPPSLTIESLRRPHASIPRNPLIAEPLFLAHVIERAGTGTLDMITLCAEAGLKPPDFRQDAGSFVQTLWRPVRTGAEAIRPESASKWWRSKPEWRPEWGTESVHQRIMVILRKEPASRSELASALGHTTISGALKNALDDLVKNKFVGYTIPEKPNSRLQKYKVLQ